MVHGRNRIPNRIDLRLNGLAGPDYDATISFGLPFEPEDSQYGKYRLRGTGGGTLVARAYGTGKNLIWGSSATVAEAEEIALQKGGRVGIKDICLIGTTLVKKTGAPTRVI